METVIVVVLVIGALAFVGMKLKKKKANQPNVQPGAGGSGGRDKPGRSINK